MATSKLIICLLVLLLCNSALTKKSLRKAQPILSKNYHPQAQLLEQDQEVQQNQEVPQVQPTDSTEVSPIEQPTQEVEPQQVEQNTETQPTEEVSAQSAQLTEQVEAQPTEQVEAQPTEQVEAQPTEQVEAQPTEQVEAQPTEQVEAQPTEQVEAQPTEQVEAQPTEQVEAQPTEQVESQPTEQVETQPTEQVEAQPTEQVEAQPIQQQEQKQLKDEDLDVGQYAAVYLMNSEGILEKVGHDGEKQFQQYEEKIIFEAMQVSRDQDLKKLPDDDVFKAEEVKKEEAQKEEQKEEDQNFVINTDDSMQIPTEITQDQSQQQANLQPLNIKVFHEQQFNFLTTFDNLILEDSLDNLSQKEITKEEMKSEDCIYLFSECNFKGSSMKSCASNPTKLSSFPLNIASIYIPNRSTLTFFHEPIQMIAKSFTESALCLDEPISLAATPAKMEMKFKDGVSFED